MTATATILRRVRSYPLHRFDFPGAVCELLAIPDLADTDLHYRAPANPVNDQDTAAHAAFYAQFPRMREGMYYPFLREHILPLFDADLCVQAVPTFRVARPDGLAVAEFHTDAEYAHQAETVNFWVPLTTARGTAAVWMETQPGSGDYSPAEVAVGQFLEFKATLLRHGNKPNRTGRARVSFDFRVIPLAAYKDSGSRTVNTGRELRLGAYYMLLRADGTFAEGDG